MQVSPINKSNTAFRCITINDDVNRFNEKQKKAVDDIVKLMREPDYYNFNGQSAEKYYESKGYNFSIVPSLIDDQIFIDAHKKVKKEEEHFVIGVFDNKNVRFRTSDIANGILRHDAYKDQERISKNLFKVLLASIVLGVGALGYFVVDAFTGKKAVNENLIENVVKPVTHSADSIVADSVKILKQVK